MTATDSSHSFESYAQFPHAFFKETEVPSFSAYYTTLSTLLMLLDESEKYIPDTDSS